MTTTTATTTFTKLRSGDWGVRSSAPLVEGATVTVAKKDGSTSTVTVEKVVWTDGSSAWLAAITPRGSSSSRRRRPGGGCVTDGNCSSFGSGRSCGAEDCDGY